MADMTPAEWESLCARCGICCLHRLKDQKNGRPFFTAIACRYLDRQTCRCRVYDHRLVVEPDCKKMTRDNIYRLPWLPRTCGYRMVAEKRELPWWHPLVSGHDDTVHAAGVSVKNNDIISEDDVIAGDILRYMILPRSAIFRHRKDPS